jgi:hypothetical protein
MVAMVGRLLGDTHVVDVEFLHECWRGWFEVALGFSCSTLGLKASASFGGSAAIRNDW